MSPDRTERACRALWYLVACQFRDTLTVPLGSDEPVSGGMVTVRPDGFVERGMMIVA